MKRLICSFLVFIMMLTMLPMTVSAYTQSPYYSDVNSSHDYYDAANFLYEHDIMKGVSDGVFGPNVVLTRAQIVTMLWRMDGSPEVEANMPFVDCKKSNYYYEAVKWAASCGVVGGIDPTHFAPDQSLTEQDALLLLYRFIRDYRGYRDDPFDDYTDNDFKELYKTYPLKGFSDYAKCAAAWAYKNEILLNANVGAKKSCPRKNIANYLYRSMIKYMNDSVTSNASAVKIESIEALLDNTPKYGRNNETAILGICRAVNNGHMYIYKSHGEEYFTFLSSDFTYVVNAKVFMGRLNDSWNSLSRVYPLNEKVSDTLSRLNKHNTTGSSHQEFMRVTAEKLPSWNTIHYTVDLAELFYHALLFTDKIEITVGFKGSCQFSFYKPYNGEINDLTKESTLVGFTPSIDLLAKPKNNSGGLFNYLTKTEAYFRGKKSEDEKLSIKQVKSTYDMIKGVVGFILDPSIADAVNLTAEYLGKDNTDTSLDHYSYEFETADQFPGTKPEDQPLTYQVKDTAPGTLKKNQIQAQHEDKFKVCIVCVPQAEFPPYVLTIDPGKKYG